MSDRGYAYFEHTADVGIEAWGPTLEVAFEEAALGLVANMVETPEASRPQVREFEVEAATRERLLYKFLEEVLFIFETELFVPLRVGVVFVGETRLHATLHGEPYDAARHGHVHEIKAITFHDLEILTTPPKVRVIVDI